MYHNPPVRPKIKRTKRKLDQVAIDDQKFRNYLEVIPNEWAGERTITIELRT